MSAAPLIDRSLAADVRLLVDFIVPGPETRQERSQSAVMALLRHALGPDVELAHREDGAPLLPGHPGLFVSISHSRNYAAVVLAPYPVGTDVEEPREQLLRVAPRVLSDRELASCRKLPEVLRAWTLKEALYKLHPGPEACDFRGNISIDPPAVTGRPARIVLEVDLAAPPAHISVVADAHLPE